MTLALLMLAAVVQAFDSHQIFLLHFVNFPAICEKSSPFCLRMWTLRLLDSLQRRPKRIWLGLVEMGAAVGGWCYLQIGQLWCEMV